MAQETRYAPETKVTVKRPDGSLETVTRPGTITDPALRRKMEQATAAAGRGQIIRWEILQPTVARVARVEMYGRRTDGYRADGYHYACGSYCDGDCQH